MHEIVLSADLGGTNLRMAAVTGSGEIVARYKRRTPDESGADAIIEAISELACECREGLDTQAKVRSLAIAAAATIVPGSGKITKSPNMPVLDGRPVADELSSRLGLTVVLENDANAAAAGESWLGASRGIANSICITLGTGVGGGLIIDGKLLRGVDGSAGEVGHICVEINGAQCGCGSRGCLEQYASATAVVRMARELRTEYPTSPLHANLNLTSLDVYKAGGEGDPLALEALRLMGNYLGVGLASLVNVLNPEMIVIGGGLADAWDLFIEFTGEAVAKRAFRAPAERAKIVPASLGDDAGILGAAHLAFQAYIKP